MEQPSANPLVVAFLTVGCAGQRWGMAPVYRVLEDLEVREDPEGREDQAAQEPMGKLENKCAKEKATEQPSAKLLVVAFLTVRCAGQMWGMAPVYRALEVLVDREVQVDLEVREDLEDLEVREDLEDLEDQPLQEEQQVDPKDQLNLEKHVKRE